MSKKQNRQQHKKAKAKESINMSGARDNNHVRFIFHFYQIMQLSHDVHFFQIKHLIKLLNYYNNEARLITTRKA